MSITQSAHLGDVVEEVRTVFERLGDETIFIPILTGV